MLGGKRSRVGRGGDGKGKLELATLIFGACPTC